MDDVASVKIMGPFWVDEHSLVLEYNCMDARTSSVPSLPSSVITLLPLRLSARISFVLGLVWRARGDSVSAGGVSGVIG